MISDGSFKDEYGTACCVIEGETPRGRIFGSCITLGNAKDQSAYRSELAGLYGIITMLEAICQYHAVTAGNAEIGCDGMQALRYGTTDTDITSPKYLDYDLISAIRAAMHRCLSSGQPGMSKVIRMMRQMLF